MQVLETLRRYALVGIGMIREEGLLAALQYGRGRIRTKSEWTPAGPKSKEWLTYYRNRSRPSPEIPRIRESADVGKVSIVVSIHGDPILSEVCLRSVLCNTSYSNYELIVIDHGAADGSRQGLRMPAEADPYVRLEVGPGNHSSSTGRNQAARTAAGEYLVLLDDNAVVTRGWIERLLAHIQRDPKIGLIGPVTNVSGNEARIDPEYRTPLQMESIAADRASRMAGRSFDIRMLELSCLLVRRDQFELLGGLDAGFETNVFSSEDLALRFRRDGRRVVCALDVFAHHFPVASTSAPDFDAYVRRFEQDRSRFEDKWGVSWEPHRFWQPSPLPGESSVDESAGKRRRSESPEARRDAGANSLVSGVFIIGCPRSGTSALSWAMAEHPALWTSEETDILLYLLRTPWLREQYQLATSQPEHRNWLINHEVSYAEYAASLGNGLDGLFRSRSGGKMWIDSTPAYTLVADQLVLHFPNARFIHIIRDGRAVVNSMLNTGFRWPEYHDFQLASSTWVSYVDKGRQLTRDYPGRVIEVRNERLVSEAADQFGRIFHFLGLPPCPESATFMTTKRINSSYLNVKKGDMRRVKDPRSMPDKPWTVWTAAQRKAFLRIAGDTMASLGYDLNFD